MRSARALLASLGAVLLLGGLSPAAPAWAEGGAITSPGPDETFVAHAVVPLRAVVDGPSAEPSELRLIEPGTGAEQVVAVSTAPGGGELAADFDTACAATVCTQPLPARNGKWTLRLRGAADDERTFSLRIPPAAPVDVRAEPAGSQVLLQWRRGAEPDLTGFDVQSGDGRLVRSGISLDACDGDGRCSLEVAPDVEAWTVRAHRRTCPDCSATLASPPSEPARLGDGPVETALPEVQPAPTGEPAPEDPDRRELVDQRDAFRQAYGTGVRGQQQAPPRPAPVGPQPAAEPDGAFDTELGYGDPAAQGPGGPLRSIEESLDAMSTGSRVLLLGMAAALVGTSWWLRRWARRAGEE